MDNTLKASHEEENGLREKREGIGRRKEWEEEENKERGKGE